MGQSQVRRGWTDLMLDIESMSFCHEEDLFGQWSVGLMAESNHVGPCSEQHVSETQQGSSQAGQAPPTIEGL
jgi:hypothetical protein